MTRPTWEEYFLAGAQWASTRAACKRRQVGAVIVRPDNTVLITGYNGVPKGELHCSDGGCPRGQLSYDECPPFGTYTNCKGRHAEHNAIDNSPEPPIGCTIYVSHEPCSDCSELCRIAGIVKAVWPDGERFF